MILRPLSLLGAVAALLVPLFMAEAASAQQPPPGYAPPPPGYAPPPPGYAPPPPGYVHGGQPDGARFRGGVALEGGAFIAPNAVTLGAVGVLGQLGVQINHNWGIFALPRFDVVFGSAGGVTVGSGILADYTFSEIPISVGLGPEVGVLGAIGGSTTANGSSSTGAAIGGAFYGATIHFAFHPVIRYREDAPRRKALSLGVDFHVLGGTYAGASETVTSGGVATSTGTVGHVAILPVVYLGYTAF